MKKVINYNFKFAQKNFTILRIKNQIQKFIIYEKTFYNLDIFNA